MQWVQCLIQALGIAVPVVGFLVHISVKVARIETDVKWLKRMLENKGGEC